MESLPDDHVTSISILSENVPINESFFEEVLSLTNHKLANEKILNAMIYLLRKDDQMKGFCRLTKLLISENTKYSREILQFEIGTYIFLYTYVRMYVYTCVHT